MEFENIAGSTIDIVFVFERNRELFILLIGLLIASLSPPYRLLIALLIGGCGWGRKTLFIQ